MGVWLRGNVYVCEFVLNGLRVKQSTGIKRTEQKAMERALEFEQKLRGDILRRQQGLITGDEYTLSQAIESTWVDRWARNKDGRGSRVLVDRILETFGDVCLSEITPQWLLQCRSQLRAERGVTETTLNRYMASLSTVLRHCQDVGIQFNLPNFKPVKTRETAARTKCFSPEEEALIIRGFEEAGVVAGKRNSKFAVYPEYADLVRVLVDTGLRLREALTLTYSHINFTENLLIIVPEHAKSGCARTVPMTSRCIEVLKRRQTVRGGDRPFAWSIYRCEAAWSSVREHLGITAPDWVWHSLRHTFATRLLRQGVDIYYVSQLLGHSSITTTCKYLHHKVAQLRQAISMLETGGETGGSEA